MRLRCTLSRSISLYLAKRKICAVYLQTENKALINKFNSISNFYHYGNIQ